MELPNCDGKKWVEVDPKIKVMYYRGYLQEVKRKVQKHYGKPGDADIQDKVNQVVDSISELEELLNQYCN